jgi:uncharacterized repeat protein (TIGR03803 family)
MTTNQNVVLRFAMIMVFALAATVAVHGQIYTVLDNLGSTNTDPLQPAWMGIIAQGRDGNLYSTTQAGGAFTNGHQYGTVFSFTPSGTMSVLHSFDLASGGIPNSGLTLGTDGSLYGTTSVGGLGYGTIFKITSNGTFTLLHNLNGSTEGIGPNTPPIQGLDGNFYGTVGNGNNAVFGTFYKMTPAGVMTVLHTFDGTNRYPRGIVMGTDGNFYGTTVGNSIGLGTVFRMTPQGKITILHQFSGTDGSNPIGQLIQANDGNFYGTAKTGGSGAQGVAYKLTPAGAFTVLHTSRTTAKGCPRLQGWFKPPMASSMESFHQSGRRFGADLPDHVDRRVHHPARVPRQEQGRSLAADADDPTDRGNPVWRYLQRGNRHFLCMRSAV